VEPRITLIAVIKRSKRPAGFIRSPFKRRFAKKRITEQNPHSFVHAAVRPEGRTLY